MGEETEPVIKGLLLKQSPGPSASLMELIQHLKLCFTNFPNSWRCGAVYKLSLRLEAPIPKPKGRHEQTKMTRTISLMNIYAKFPNKMPASHCQQSMKRTIHHGQVGFMAGILGWLNAGKRMDYIRSSKEQTNPTCYFLMWNSIVLFLWQGLPIWPKLAWNPLCGSDRPQIHGSPSVLSPRFWDYRLHGHTCSHSTD